jgi:repressor LexA
MDGLTAKQLEVAQFIQRFRAANGYPPTRREIALNFGWASINAAEEHIRALVRKGVLTIDTGIARGMKLVDAALVDAALSTVA